MLDMGFLPDIRRVLQHLPPPRADALLLGHPAAADRRAGRRDAARAGARSTSSASRPRRPASRRRSIRSPEDLKPYLLRRAAAAGGHQERARLHPHQAPGQPPGRVPREARRPLRPHPRQPQPGAAHGRPRRLQERRPAGAGGDRHRRPRHRRRGALARHQLRRPQRPRGLHPPRRPHRPRGDGRRRLHLRRADEETAELARDRARGRQAAPAPHGRGVRLRGAAGGALRDPARRSGSPRSAPAAPRSAPGPGPRRRRRRSARPRRRPVSIRRRSAAPRGAPSSSPASRVRAAGPPRRRGGSSRRVRSARASPATAPAARTSSPAGGTAAGRARVRGRAVMAAASSSPATATSMSSPSRRGRSIPRPSRPRSVWRRSAIRSLPPASTGSAGSPTCRFSAADHRLTRH